jgi:hypothetical protein
MEAKSCCGCYSCWVASVVSEAEGKRVVDARERMKDKSKGRCGSKGGRTDRASDVPGKRSES